jgi:hypothetical protein
MSWERRRNGPRYYYRAQRIGGRVAKTYVGREGTPEADFAAATDALKRAERQEERRAHQATEARLQAADEPLDAVCLGTDLLMEVSLALAGIFRHGGEWRRKQDGPEHQARDPIVTPGG